MTCSCDHTLSSSLPALIVNQTGTGLGCTITQTASNTNAAEIHSSTTNQSALWADSSGSGYCIVGSNTSANPGVYGTNTGGNYGPGVYGNGNYGVGVYGTSAYGTAIKGVTSYSGGIAIYGLASNGAQAGYFQGPVQVTGWLTKSGGGFKIDHPSDPENKYLNHCFVESPEMLNLYSGVATLDKNGNAEISLPSYFDAANEDPRIQLTAVGAAMPSLHVSVEVSNGVFSVSGGVPGKKVSWDVKAARADKWAKANHPGVEIDKASKKGLFLHPELFGHDASKHINGHHNDAIIPPDFIK